MKLRNLLAAALLLTASAAIAQTALPPLPSVPGGATPAPVDLNFEVRQDDASVALLRSILGNWGGNILVPVVGNMFQVLNSAALILGIILTVYITAVGVLRSGQDGEFLGRGWSKVFIPARLVAGNAMLAPTASGFSMVQVFVLWLALQGIAMANQAWNAALTGLIGSQGQLVAARMAAQQDIAPLAYSVLRSEICIATVMRLETLRQNRPADEPMPIMNVRVTPGTQRTFGGTSTLLEWGNDPAQAGGMYSRNGCGSIELNDSRAKATEIAESLWHGAELAAINGAMASAQARGITQMVNVLRPVAQALVAADHQNTVAGRAPEEIVRALRAAVDAYVVHTGESAQRALASLHSTMTADFQREAQKTGWITAGAWYYQIARLNSSFSEIASAVPAFTLSGDGTLMGYTADTLRHLDAAIEEGIVRAPAIAQANAGQRQGGIVGGIAWGMNRVTNSATQWAGELVSVDPGNSTNALIQLKHVGDNVISVATATFLGKQAADAGMAVAGKTPLGAVAKAGANIAWAANDGPWSKIKKFLGKFASETGDAALSTGSLLIVFALIGLISFAAILAFWLPMAPLIIWLGGVLGWLISVIEMVIAAPLWAVAHIHPEGEGMAGKYGANGYMIIVEVFCRPILMIIGLVMSILVLDPFLKFVSVPFWNAMGTINAEQFPGFITFVAFVMIYSGVNLALVHQVFALIHVIPNSVLRWIGAHSNSFDRGEQMANNIQGNVMTYFAAGNRAVGQAGKAAGFTALGSRPERQAMAEGAGVRPAERKTAGDA